MNRSLHALLVALMVLLLLPATGSAAALIATGTLTDMSGAPAGGQIRAYGWVFPERGQILEMPLLGTATADADGRFSVRSNNDERLRLLAGLRRGFVDVLVVGDTGTYNGSWGFTGFVDSANGIAHVSAAEATIEARAAGAVASTAAARTPEITVRARSRTAFTRAAQFAGCDSIRRIRARGSMRKMTVIGEINNAYNDGTQGIFEYSRRNTAETTIGAATQLENGSWSISAEYTVTNKGSIRFPPFERRISRKLRSLFEYTRYEVQSSSCAAWGEPYIRATSWIGDYDYSIKQDGIDKCDARFLEGAGGGGRWERTTGAAVRFTRAVEAFGVNLTARSGFSDNVSLAYRWGGAEAKKHYICGADGKASAFTTGRVFSGSRK